MINVDEKYKNSFYELAEVTNSTIIEEYADGRDGIPEYVIELVKRAQEQVKNGQTKTYEDVKAILRACFPD